MEVVRPAALAQDAATAAPAAVWAVSAAGAPPAVPGPAVPAGLGGCLPSCNLLEAGVWGRYAAALALRVRAAFFAGAERSCRSCFSVYLLLSPRDMLHSSYAGLD